MDERSQACASETGVGRGIGLAFLLVWLVPLVVWAVVGAVARVLHLPDWMSGIIAAGLLLATNPFALIGLGYWIAKHNGKPGIAKGLLIGLVIWLALGVLLAAACFGILFFSMLKP